MRGYGSSGSFSGAFRGLPPRASADDRAGLLATFYIEYYTAFGLPVILAGLATGRFGLERTAEVYGTCDIILALVSTVLSGVSAAGFTAENRRPQKQADATGR